MVAEGVTTPTYAPPEPLAYETTYVWRIDAVNADGTTPGDVWTFATEPEPVEAPEKAVEPMPADAAENQPIGVHLMWADGGGADTFNVYFGAEGTTLAMVAEGVTTPTYAPPEALAYETTYVWRIDAVNADGTTPGDVWSFATEPEPLAPPEKAIEPMPANGAVEVPVGAHLMWANGGGATSFNVYLGAEGTTPTLVAEGVTTPTYAPPEPLAYETTHTWRVDAVNGAGVTAGDVWTFVIEDSPPEPPQKAVNPVPADGSVNQPIGVQLMWADGGDTPFGGPTRFNVYLGVEGTTPTLVAEELTTPTYAPPESLAYATTYVWRVDAVNEDGTTVGDTWTFVTEPEPLAPPEKAIEPMPENGAANVPVGAHLMWADGGGASSFNVYVGMEGTTPTMVAEGLTTTTYGPPEPLAYRTTYTWRIDAVNGAGVTAGDVWTFVTGPEPLEPPEKVIEPMPENGAANVPVAAHLMWADGGRADTFNVYFGAEGTTLALVAEGGTTTTYGPPEALAYETTYIWRIDAVNEDGTTVGDTWTFVTEPEPLEPPAKAVDPMPANGAANQPVGVHLMWADGGGAASYNVYLAVEGTTLAMVADGVATTTFAPPEPLAYETSYTWRVDSENEDGTTAGDVWTFATEPEPLEPPQKAVDPDPADGATDQDAELVLAWTGGGGATSYNIYIGAGAGTLTLLGQTAAPNIASGELDYEVTYTWRVDSVNDSGVTPGDAWTFVTEAAPVPAGQATDPMPADGAGDQPADVHLMWTDGGGTDTFDVYLGTDPASLTLVAEGLTTTSYAPPEMLAYETSYSWRIDSVNEAGVTEGAVWTFATGPRPLEPPLKAVNPMPADGAVNQPVDVHLMWEDGGKAETYNVYFGETGTTLTMVAEATTDTMYAPPEALAFLTSYSWRVDAMNQDGMAEGDVWSFVTEARPLNPPEKAIEPMPASGAANQPLDVVLSWADGGGATSFDVSFGPAGALEMVGNQTELAYAPAGLVNDTAYEWRIDARNADGVTMGDVWTFTTVEGPKPPEKALLVGPGNGAANQPLNAILAWEDGGGALTFEVYFGAQGTTLALVATQTTPTHAPELAAGTTYVWRVDSVNQVGTTTGDTWTFTTEAAPQAPGKARNLSPIPGAQNVVLDALLRWSPAKDAASYNVYFGTGAEPQMVGNQTTRIYDPGLLDPGTAYSWRVDPVNAIGTTTGDVWTFTTTNALPPEKAVLVSPANGATGVLINEPLRWENGGGAVMYKVWLGVATDPPLLFSWSVQAETEFQPYFDLEWNRTYPYAWRIDAIDANGVARRGDVWTFRTAAAAPPVPQKAINPNPVHVAGNVSLRHAVLSWEDGGGAQSFDVYFGKVGEDLELLDNQVGTAFALPELEPNTEYAWRINSVNISGASFGDWWSFTTASGPLDIVELVEHFYLSVLGRPAEPGAADAWKTGYFDVAVANQIDVRFVAREMGRLFFLSDEYTSRGRTDGEFIADCYGTFLLRDPSQEELDSWLNDVISTETGEVRWNRPEVMTQFAESTEFEDVIVTLFPGLGGDPARNLVTFMYIGVLDRLADSSGLVPWADNMTAAEDKTQAARQLGMALFASEEYLAKADTDAKKVERLYRAFLGRFPSDSDVEAWLANGFPGIETMIDLFAASGEFQDLLAIYFPTPPGEAVN